MTTDLSQQIEAVATRLASDPWLGVRDRTLAVAMCSRARLGLPIDADDARQLRAVYARRRREIARLSGIYP